MTFTSKKENWVIWENVQHQNKRAIHMYTRLYLKWISNKMVLYSTGNSAQCYVEAWMAGEFRGEWIHVYIWLSSSVVHLKLPQQCYLATLQYKIKNFLEIWKTAFLKYWNNRYMNLVIKTKFEKKIWKHIFHRILKSTWEQLLWSLLTSPYHTLSGSFCWL